MLDPSFLFSEDGVTWLEQERPELESIVVSAALAGWLSPLEPEPPTFIDRNDWDDYADRRDRLVNALRDAPRFAYSDVESTLDPASREVLNALRTLDLPDVHADILADEWAFLQSHSWMIAKLQGPIDAFRDCGAAVVQFGRKLRDQMIEVVIPEGLAPPALTLPLVGKAGAKWIVVGGATAGGTLLGPAGALLGLAAVPVVRAFDP
jgi:hypothetical protein